MEVGYIGSSYKLAEEILFNKSLKLRSIITERGRINKDIVVFSKINDIPFYLVNSYDELSEVVSKLNINKFIMYNFGMVIRENLINDYTIINIHQGDLRFHRGRNPLSRTIINNEKSVKLTAHEINVKIDSGKVINEFEFNVGLKDTVETLQTKMEQNFNLLLKSIYAYFTEGSFLYESEDGMYEARVQEKDFVIDLEKDNVKELYNKIRSQSNYKGAVLYYHDVKYYVKDIKSITPYEDSKLICRELKTIDKELYVLKEGFKICLSIEES